MTLSGYTIRPATLADAKAIQEHRRAMFADMGTGNEATREAMSARFLPWFHRKMKAGEYLAWVAVAPDGAIAAGLGLWLMDWPPHLIGDGAPRGNILNVYTHPNHRRRGIARELMLTSLDWCRTHGIRAVVLHASREGRALYESMGFEPTNEMRLMLGE